jgi:hypothetical protein
MDEGSWTGRLVWALLNMTQNSCIARCYDKKYPYAGIEYGQECYCGLIIGTDSDIEDDRERSFKYSGVAEEACGSNKRLTVFCRELLNFTRTSPGPPNTSHIGSFTDDVYAGTLAIAQSSDDDMTVARCTSSCRSAGFTIAGLEYGTMDILMSQSIWIISLYSLIMTIPTALALALLRDWPWKQLHLTRWKCCH